MNALMPKKALIIVIQGTSSKLYMMLNIWDCMKQICADIQLKNYYCED